MWERLCLWEGLFIRELCVHMVMGAKQPATTMARRRALLTDRERELIAEDDPDDENRRYQAISRARNKIQDELPNDVELLAESHPQLLSELQNVVCEDVGTLTEYREQLQEAHEQIEELESSLNDIEAAFNCDDPDAARTALERAQEAVSKACLDD